MSHFSHSAGTVIAATTCAALLGACSGGGSRSAGFEADIKAITTAAQAESPTAAIDTTKTFRRADGMRIELELGLLNLAPVELVPCTTTASAIGSVLRALNPIGVAVAHSDHIGTPPAGPVNAAEANGNVFDLGSIVAEPGRYCGLTVELTPEAATAAKHGDLDTDLSGHAINVAPCYYPNTAGLSDADAAAATEHHCVQTRALTSFRHFTLPFAEPVELDDTHRHLDLTVVSRYEEWFDGIDMDALESDAVEQGRLIDNIVAAMHVLTGNEQNIALAFDIEVGGDQAMCNAVYQGIGTGAQQDYELSDFRFYVSDLRLQGNDGSTPISLATRANGTAYQDAAHNVALLGLAQGCGAPEVIRNLSVAGRAKQGDYDTLCFTLGVPFELNHQEVATAQTPLNVTAMAWSWLSGHKFLRVDGVGDADGVRQNFFLHLGSTGCTNGSAANGAPPDGPCGSPNLAEICVDFNAIRNGSHIVADIAPVLADVDIASNTPDTAAGCMSGNSDPECVPILPKLGLDFQYGGNTIPRQDQQLFTVQP
ncbi:MAG: metallo-mystery pair system four-Cys motif protein [Nevskiales bacterium]|nr:metallo-mystery pair system four-Cys motif protein [Nevskiales bacterium]